MHDYNHGGATRRRKGNDFEIPMRSSERSRGSDHRGYSLEDHHPLANAGDTRSMRQRDPPPPRNHGRSFDSDRFPMHCQEVGPCRRRRRSMSMSGSTSSPIMFDSFFCRAVIELAIVLIFPIHLKNVLDFDCCVPTVRYPSHFGQPRIIKALLSSVQGFLPRSRMESFQTSI